jgi:hypothetical protein
VLPRGEVERQVLHGHDPQVAGESLGHAGILCLARDRGKDWRLPASMATPEGAC